MLKLIKEENGASFWAKCVFDNINYLCFIAEFFVELPRATSSEETTDSNDNLILFSKIEIPKEINNCTVTTLESAFVDCNSSNHKLFKIKQLILPNSLCDIKASAFQNNNTFINIVWPESVKTIPMGCFSHSSIEKVIIPNGITTIDSYAFFDSNIKKLNVPSSCKKIGTNAFQHSKLEVINLPSNISSIGISAFKHSNVKEIIWPEKCNIVPYGCFYGCENLRRIKFCGVVSSISRSAISETPSLVEIDFFDIISHCEISQDVFRRLRKINDVKYPFYGILSISDK